MSRQRKTVKERLAEMDDLDNNEAAFGISVIGGMLLIFGVIFLKASGC